MNLFDKLVSEALKNQPFLSPLRIVVEKELLHHDILRVMRDNNMSAALTFIGGTCLRCCYGSIRLSEDLDFTGGKEFSRLSLSHMGKILKDELNIKYGLTVMVSEPIKDKQNVDTWKIKIETRPEAKHLPAQRINIDICALPSYEPRPMMLLNPYGVDMGTSGLILQAQSREEIFADKLIAFACRPNRFKYRDIWDIIWLHGQSIQPRLTLIPFKLRDRNFPERLFLKSFEERRTWLSTDHKIFIEFRKEMQRFLMKEAFDKMLAQENLWIFFINLMEGFNHELKKKFNFCDE